EMGIDLACERLDLCREQQLLLFLQAMLDARVVPDFDRRGDPEHGGQHDDRQHPEGIWRPTGIEETLVGGPAAPEALTKQFEGDWREQQHDLPVDLHLPQHLPGAARDASEYERREVPDGFLRAQRAESATSEAAADCKRQRDELAANDRRQ